MKTISKLITLGIGGIIGIGAIAVQGTVNRRKIKLENKETSFSKEEEIKEEIVEEEVSNNENKIEIDDTDIKA